MDQEKPSMSDDPIQKLMDSPERMTHITHDAREVVDRLNRKDDLNVWWQMRLMEHVYRIGQNLVVEKMTPGKKDVKEEWINKTMRELLIFRSTELSKCMPDGARKVDFSVKATRNLQRIDQMVLSTDYTVRLHVLGQYLDDISDEALTEIIEGLGHVQMYIMFSRLEGFFAAIDEDQRRMAQAREYQVEPRRQSTPEGLAFLERAIDDLQSLPKREDPS
jgi:hypothetical protein